jgi:hypothetical protein
MDRPDIREPLEAIGDRVLSHLLASRLLVMQSTKVVARARWLVAKRRLEKRRLAGHAPTVRAAPKPRRQRRSYLNPVR